MAGVQQSIIELIESGRIQQPDQSIRGKIETAIQAGAISAQRQAAGEAVPQSETMVRAYDNLTRMNSDAALLTQQGWQIVAQSESKQGRGCLTFFAAPKITRTVTYQRTLTSGQAGASLL